jgi:ring-1,2-phenylacetyl-CoA epoxidase subunit PaaD
MSTADITKERVLELLVGIPDPEIPVINIVELGIVRDVTIKPDGLQVKITPTYSGCPAMKMIENQIVEHLKTAGFADVKVVTTFTPAWTTDWLTPEAKEKMRRYGIAPPGMVADHKDDLFSFKPRPVPCPYCSSGSTERQAEFGSTPCKAQYYCNDCREPFEHFKCH